MLLERGAILKNLSSVSGRRCTRKKGLPKLLRGPDGHIEGRQDAIWTDRVGDGEGGAFLRAG